MEPLQPAQPSLLWRMGSVAVFAVAGGFSRLFLLGASRLEVNGLDNFLKLLDERADVDKRERGLLTVSNHLSVLDDPTMWGALPLRILLSPNDMRWALGSHDIVFKNKALATFFSLGQTLPTHRLAHSPHGGLFQPTITQAIRLLSRAPFTNTFPPSSLPALSTTATPTPPTPTSPNFLITTHAVPHPIDSSTDSGDIPDPFTHTSLTYTTTGLDTFPTPSAYHSRRHAWLHIYAEGRTHQRTDKTMRYFKWGVARLILEAEPAPLLVPMWIEGLDQVMHESREWPRFLPRVGKGVSVTWGEGLETGEGRWGKMRGRWRELVEREREVRRGLEGGEGREVEVEELGVVKSENLRCGEEARKLREEVTLMVREEVLKLRRARGWPDEDPKVGRVETWRVEGATGKREGKMDDGSWVKDT